MKRYIVSILWSLIFLSPLHAQTIQDVLGIWEIYKVDIGDVSVDEKGTHISTQFTDKLIGQKDSALSVNLLVGTLKNLLGMEYSFKVNDELSQYNPSNRKIRKGKYSYNNKMIKAVINNITEEYKIISVDKKYLILEIHINEATNAEVYLINRS